MQFRIHVRRFDESMFLIANLVSSKVQIPCFCIQMDADLFYLILEKNIKPFTFLDIFLISFNRQYLFLYFICLYFR